MKVRIMNDLKNKLTIVIPSKNEDDLLYKCIYNISEQTDIIGTKIIISDSSTTITSKKWLEKIITDFSKILDITIIEGGLPSKARYLGSKKVTTPYVLFLDSDILIKEKNFLFKNLNKCEDLLTCTITTDTNYNWIYDIFNYIQSIGIKRKEYFAIGGFQLWNTKKYWEIGGYDETDVFAEDYVISRKLGKNNGKIKVISTKNIYTSSRRFKNKGIFYMFKIMFLSYINRENKDFFKKEHNYWN